MLKIVAALSFGSALMLSPVLAYADDAAPPPSAPDANKTNAMAPTEKPMMHHHHHHHHHHHAGHTDKHNTSHPGDAPPKS